MPNYADTKFDVSRSNRSIFFVPLNVLENSVHVCGKIPHAEWQGNVLCVENTTKRQRMKIPLSYQYSSHQSALGKIGVVGFDDYYVMMLERIPTACTITVRQISQKVHYCQSTFSV